ncbi:MAG: glycosyltransferase family 39 protein [Chloroflexota bacterium]
MSAAPPTPGLHAAGRRRRASDILCLGVILAVATAMRLVNLGVYSGLFDEGIRGEQLFLMSAGYRPFRDIFAAQGPLLLDALYPWFRLFGEDLVAARLSVAVYSLAGIAATYWVTRLTGGVVAAAAAAGLLSLSQLYLEGSRLALAEVPCMAPAIASVGAMICYTRSGSRRWLCASAALFATGLLMKPICIAAAVPLGLLLLTRPRIGWRATIVDAVIFGGLVALIAATVILAVGLNGVLDQIFAYRRAATASDTGNFWKNRVALVRALSFEQTALFGMAIATALCAAILRRWPVLTLAAWTGASTLLLLFYSPLHGKHVVILIPPTAALVGAGVGLAIGSARGAFGPVARVVGAASLAAFFIWYAWGLPGIIGQTGQLMRVTADTDVDPAIEQYADAVSALKSLTGPADYVVTDQPYIPFLAGRLVPPALVDTSKTRIDAGFLRGAEAVSLATPYQPAAVLLWNDRLRRLQQFIAWVEAEFRLVKVYNRRLDQDRGLYVHAARDLAEARRILASATPSAIAAHFGDRLVLVAVGIDRESFRRGEGAAVTLQWESLAALDADYQIITVLRGADGTAWDQQQERLSGGSLPTSRWPAGHWLFQHTFVRAEQRVPPGRYTVGVSVYDSRSRRLVPTGSGNEELAAGTVEVR